ncbi:hypothetical protein GBAR_LOCUS7132 [Geodia barretti]|uniref:Uncharacterized protein n=1 Tax=Geodia barretti TaxID=519541 RepID=A0AA35RGA4_GEOBA|nr:hypothetical protein GBAR_LOCUS7132 [Geodia barretti]
MSQGVLWVNIPKSCQTLCNCFYCKDVSPANRRHILTRAAGYFCDKIAKSQEVTMIASLTQRV